jgi:hypothetical protein
LYFSVSPSTNGNSSIFEKALLFNVTFPSANSVSVLTTQTIIASYPSLSRVLKPTTFSVGTFNNVTGINLSSLITLVISNFVAMIHAITKFLLTK